MENMMSGIENVVNAGIKAAGISWATAKSWSKEVRPGQIMNRIYLKVGSQSAGYIEVAMDGTLSVPRRGTGSNVNRPALARVIDEIVAGINTKKGL